MYQLFVLGVVFLALLFGFLLGGGPRFDAELVAAFVDCAAENAEHGEDAEHADGDANGGPELETAQREDEQKAEKDEGEDREIEGP